MRQLKLRISVSIDGFIESRAHNIDFSKSRSPEGAAWLTEKMQGAGAHLLGKNAFCDMASFWPTAQGALAACMNGVPKIVFSKKGFNPARVSDAKGWSDARTASADLSEEIAALKAQDGKDLIAHGGILFAQSLIQTGLIDEYLMAVHPVAVGRGPHLFEKLGTPIALTLIETRTFASGAMAHVFRPQLS